MPETDAHLQPLELPVLPLDDAVQLALGGEPGPGAQLPPEMPGLLVERDPMAAQRGHPCCFQPGRTGADHRHVEALLGRGRLAPGQLAPRLWIVDASNRAAGESIADAHVGAHARPNVVASAIAKLGDQIRVRDVSPGHADHVGFAVCENPLGFDRIGDTPDREHRQLDGGADPSREVDVKTMRGRGGRPVLGALDAVHVGAGDDVEIVHLPVAFDRTGDGLHLLQIEPALHQLVAGNAKAHDAVTPHRFAHRRDHLSAEPHTVLEAAPVVVGSPIGYRGQKRRDQESERGQDLDAVHPSLAATVRRGAECAGDLRDLVHAHRVRALTVPHQLTHYRRGRPDRSAGLGGMAGGGAVAELGEDDPAFLVDSAGENAIAVDDGVVDIGERAARSQSPGVMDGGAAGDLEPSPAARPRPMVGGVARTGDTAVTETDLVRGHQNAATKLFRTNPDRREQMRKVRVSCGLGVHVIVKRLKGTPDAYCEHFRVSSGVSV